MKRAEQLQPPVDTKPREGVTVRLKLAPSDDPALLARFDRWLQKLLQQAGTPDHKGRRP